MELVARKADLVRELQFFQQIVERKNTIPILANVLIETDGNAIRLLATDIEVTLTSSCEAAVDKPGGVTLPAKKLYEIVRSLPDGDVKLASSKDGNHVTVSADRFESKMPTMPVGDFPTPPASEMANATTIAVGGAASADHQDPVCHHRRRHALLPERRALRGEVRRHDDGGHRRPSPGSRDGARASAARATTSRPSCRARRWRSSDACSPTAIAMSNTNAARTTCSSASGRGCWCRA